MENNNFIMMLQAMLDKVKSLANIKKDIKSIESNLKIKIQGTLDKTATKKEINTNLKSIKPKIKVDADTSQATKKIKKLGQQKTKTTIQPTVDNSQVMSSLKATQKETKSLFDRFLNGAVGVNLVRMSVQKVTQAIYQAIAAVKELDTIKTNIQMVSKTSDSEVNALMNSYNSMAKNLSSTTKSVSEAANEFLRMGESINTTNELIKSSQILSKTGMIESSDAASYLISSLKGYQIAAKDSIDIVDKLTAVDLNAAVSAGGLAEAISRCSNIANNSGTSMDRLIGYAATIGEVTQESMSVVGNSLKSMYSRMSNIKIGRFIDDETGESLSDTEAVLNKLGIQLRDTEDTYRNFDEVLNDIGSRWKSLTQVEQNAISVAMAGTMQRERFTVLMNNWSNALKYSEVATDSAGSALQRYSTYQNSLEAKTNELTAAIESLSTNIISEDLYSGIIQATTGVVEFLDKTNLLKASLTGLVAMGISKAFVSMGAGIITAYKSTAQLTAAMALFDKGRSTANLLEIGEACKGLSDRQLKLVLSTQGLTQIQRMQILEGMGVAEAEREQTLTTLGLAAAEDKAIASSYSLKGAWNALKVTFAGTPIKAATTAITATILAVKGVIAVVKAFAQAEKRESDAAEELYSKSKERVETNKEEAKSLDELIKKYEELKSKSTIDSDTREEIKNIQYDIVELVGSEAKTLDLVNGKLDEQLAKLKEISIEKSIQNVEDASDDYYNPKYVSETMVGDADDYGNDVSIKWVGTEAKQIHKVDGFEHITYDDFVKYIRDKGFGDIFRKNNDETLMNMRFVVDTTDIKGLEEKIARLKEFKEFLAENGFRSTGIYQGVNDSIGRYEEQRNNELESANNLAKSIINDLSISNVKLKEITVDSVETFEEYRQKMLEEINSNESIGEMLADGTLSKDDLEIAINDFMATSNEFSTWYEQWQNSLSQDDTISNPTISIEDAKKAINGTDDVTGLIDELSLLQEVLSDTGNVQEETYEKLLSCSAKYSTAIRTENGRITLNTTKLKQVAKARQIDTKETIKETLALKKQEWIQWKNKIDNFNGSLLESIEEKYEDIDVLQKEITQYELLVNSLDNAASAFERFKAAQQTNDQDMYDTAKDAFDVLKEYSSDKESDNYGKYNRDEFQEAVMLLMDNDTYRKALNAKDLEEYQNVVDSFVKSIAPLFDENNAKSASNLFDEVDKIIKSGDVPKADTDWAERLGISEEVFNALKQLANLYDYNNKEVFESYQLNTLDNYQEKLSNVKAAQDALNECTDKTSNEYLRLSKELDAANQKLSEFEQETTDNVTDAWKDYNKYTDSQIDSLHDAMVHMDANSKAYQEFSDIVDKYDKPFSEYLKDTLGFDENDITGVIDVALDQIGKLQDTMSHMDPKSKAYKEFSDRVSQLTNIVTECGYSFEDASDKKDDFESSSGKSKTNNIDAYKKLSQQAKEYTETLAQADIGSVEYQLALNGLQQVQSAMEGLKEPVKIEIQTNIDEIDSKISAVESKISGLKQAMANTTNANAQMAIQSQINGAENEKTSLEGRKADLEQTLKIVVDDDEALEKIDAVSSSKIEDKGFKITATDEATSIIEQIDSKQIGDKEFNIKAKFTPWSPLGGGVSENSAGVVEHAKGTVGNAFASGYNGLPSKEKSALRSEYGQKELTVYPNGTYEITDKPTLSDLPKGTVIFNEEQTERILKGNAHADGTVGKAFNNGMGTDVNPINFKDVTGNNKAIVNAKKEVTDAVDEAAEEAKDKTEEIFDWIERRVKRFQRFFDKWLKQAETALTNTFITKYYKKATSNLNKLLSTQADAFNRYMQEVNNVGLDEAYASKVRNGTIDIETITDEELADKIQKYQEFYDKATDATTSFVETAEQLYNLPLDKAATKIEQFSDAIDLLDKKLDNTIGSKKKNALIDDQTKEEKKTLKSYKTAKKESKKNLKSAGREMTKSDTLKSPDVSSKEKKLIKKAVKKGNEINLGYFTEGSEAYNAAVKYNEALKANTQATYDLSVAQQEYNSWLVEASKIKFDNIADDYDKKVQMIDHQIKALDNSISEIETAGKNVNRSYYDTQKTINAQKLEEYKQEKAALEKSIKKIKEGTDEWYDAYDQIQQVSSSISDCEKETYNLNNAINQLHFDLFNDIADSIDRIITEQEFLQGLFAHEKTVDSETGTFTDAGIAKLGSLSASYNAAKGKADNDKEMIDKLQYMLDNKQLSGFGLTFNSVDDLEEKLKEMYTTWQNDIKETYSLESSLVDTMKEKYQAELDMLKNLIDKKKEALQAEKDLHDYQKTLNEKTTDIDTIKKQIAAYSGDSSQEAMAKLQKLQKELADKEEDLRETEYDRYISDQQDMLDKLYTEYEELITKKLNDFMGLFKEGLEFANNNLSGINDYLSSIATTNGYTEETKGLFSGVSGSIQSNTDRIIATIESNATANSGTISDATSGNTSNVGSGAGTNGNNGSNGKDGVVSQNPAVYAETPLDFAKRYIKEHVNNHSKGKAKSAYSDVNQAIWDNEAKAYSGKGKVLSANELKELASNLGVKYDNASKSGKLYKKLHKIGYKGFKNGGIAKLVKSKGEDGVAMVRNGEGLIAPEHVSQIQELVDNVPEINKMTESFKKFSEEMTETDKVIRTSDGIELIPAQPTDLMKIINAMPDINNIMKPNLPDLSSMIKSNIPDARSSMNTNNVINIDNISLPNVTNAEEFADTLLPVFQRKKGFEKLVKSMTTEQLAGAGALNKYRHKF